MGFAVLNISESNEKNIGANDDWSALEISDLKHCARFGISLEGSAALLNRPVHEVANKAANSAWHLRPILVIYDAG